MRRPSPWLMLVVLLLGILLLREPRFAHAEDLFLTWLLEHAQGAPGPPVPLTVVEISRDALMDPQSVNESSGGSRKDGAARPALSPLEFALFLQSILDFQPSVVAFENILKWRDRDKDQEQVFLDQAMRVPKLLLASELGSTVDPDAPWADIHGFTNVTGKRGELAEFSGIGREPNEDLRLISTQGFANLPPEVSSPIKMPLLFLHRGQVIPSFPLQAIMLWLKVTPAEVEVVLGSHIMLPQNRRIPIQADGTLRIDPNAGKRARRMSLNELLLAAQQRDSGNKELSDLHDQIVLARTPDNPLSPPDLFAATIATIQGGAYLHRITPVFDCVVLLLIAAFLGTMRRVERFDLVLCGIAITAAYCLVAMGAVAHWNVWLPGLLPLGALWSAIFVAFFFPNKNRGASREATIAIPPAVA